jgi:hypothetical protein
VRIELVDGYINSRCEICGCNIRRRVSRNGTNWEAFPPDPQWSKTTCPQRTVEHNTPNGHAPIEEYWT